MRALTPEEWHRVASALKSQSSDALAMCTVLVTSGMRRSELAGLRWSDVDIDRQVLHIRRSYHVVRGEKIFKSPKTTRSSRDVALDESTTKFLRLQRNQAQTFADLADRPLSLSAPVFTPDGVRPYAPDSITHMWQRARTAVGLSDVRLQDLRHTTATLSIAAGVNIGAVADKLGHATPGFTLSVYRHAVPGEQQDAANKLAAYLNVDASIETDQTG
ncbi:MAG: site-specific integrase [Chloroflexi bacterium]|nr:site-specific integrase [Chloroflexota bacterium]